MNNEQSNNSNVTTAAHDGNVERVTTSDIVAAAQAGRTGILSTAVHPQMGAPASALTDDTIVTHQGMQLSLAQAARLGLVQKDAQGNYTEVQGQSDEQQEEQQAANENAPVAFNEQSESLLAHVAGAVPSEYHTKVVEEVISKGIDGLDMNVAELSGLDGAAYVESVDAVRQAFQAQADGWIQSTGVEPSAFYEWALANHPKETREAMRQHVAGRNPKAYGPLLQAYVKNTEPSTQAMNRGGLQTRTDNHGTEYVDIPGIGWVAVKAAAKAGLI